MENEEIEELEEEKSKPKIVIEEKKESKFSNLTPRTEMVNTPLKNNKKNEETEVLDEDIEEKKEELKEYTKKEFIRDLIIISILAIIIILQIVIWIFTPTQCPKSIGNIYYSSNYKSR